jgi:TP901-1 family phage major tail protein
MTAQKGRDLLLKVDSTGGGAFSTIGGLRTRSLSFENESVDVTNADSSGQWRELLAGGGVKRAKLSGAGVFKDDAADAVLRQILFDGIIRTWKVIIPDFGTIEGAFQIVSLDYSGTHQSELNFELALESAGALTFTAA